MRYFKTAERFTRRSQPHAPLRSCWALLASLLVAPAIHAAEPARVLLVAPPDASSLVSEALVRAQGELFAVGLASTRTGTVPTDAGEATPDNATEPPRLPTDVYGLLVLEQREGVIIIHAWAPHATASLDARIELSGSVTAEVVAVKAVETLRAAMVQFARRERGAVPEAVRGFTKGASDENQPHAARVKPPAKPAPTTPTPAADSEPSGASTQAERGPTDDGRLGMASLLGAWIGPQLALVPGAGGALGGQLGVLVGPRWGFIALAFDTSFGKLQLDETEGDATIQRRALTLQVGGRLRAARAWEAFARAGVGYAGFDVRGRGEDGYRGVHLTHASFTLQANSGVAWWLTRSLGLYGNLGAVLALDAPSVRIAGRRVATLDQPSIFMSVGATAAMF